MTQDAIVTKCLPGGMAEVVVSRGTACGGSCSNCESCIYQTELKTLAKNRIDARPGQKVIIESKSSRVYGAAFLAYIVPIVLVILGYALASALGAGEGICVLASFLGLILGAAILVLSQRRKSAKPISFDIVSFNA